MENLLSLAQKYSREKHELHIPVVGNDILEQIEMIYDDNWESANPPYYVLTYLVDCYYCLPKRPDLASLFGCQAINHCYNEWLIDDLSKHKLQDTAGIKELVNRIYSDYSKYRPILLPFYNKIPIKMFHYIASYLVKGFVLEKTGTYDEKY